MANKSATQPEQTRRVVDLLAARRDEILNLWIKERLDSDEFREELISKKELRQQSQQIVDTLARAIQESDGAEFDDAAFDELDRKSVV